MTKLRLILIALMLSSCTQKIKIIMLQPAEIDIKTKNIEVKPFKNDKITDLTGQLETQLTKVRFNGQSYFNIVNSREIQHILKEQKRQKSGLYADSSIEVGELIGAEASISGNIIAVTQHDQRHKEVHKKCEWKKGEKKKCYDITVRCTKRKITMSANLRITDLTLGAVMYSDSPEYSLSGKHCSDDSIMLPTKSYAAQSMAHSIAKDFIFKLTPNYINIYVALLDSEDIDYTDTEEALLKNGLKFIKQNRIDKAEQLLSTLLTSTQSKSYVAAYNLGVIKESKGHLKEAQKYYMLADSLQIEPVEAINKAVMRIRISLQKRKSALKQVNRHTKQ